MNYTEKDIKRALDTFQSVEDKVENGMHKLIAHDYLVQNMSIKDYLICRHIYIGYLQACLLQLVNSNDISLQLQEINKYCNKNHIYFDKYKNLKAILKTEWGRHINQQFAVDIREKYRIENVVNELGNKLNDANNYNVHFDISEYVSYFDMNLDVLYQYLNIGNEHYELIKDFYQRLRDEKQINEITKKNKDSKLSYLFNPNLFNEIERHLKLVRIPVLNGTVRYVEKELNNGTDLYQINKVYIKRKYEEKLNSKKM